MEFSEPLVEFTECGSIFRFISCDVCQKHTPHYQRRYITAIRIVNHIKFRKFLFAIVDIFGKKARNSFEGLIFQMAKESRWVEMGVENMNFYIPKEESWPSRSNYAIYISPKIDCGKVSCRSCKKRIGKPLFSYCYPLRVYIHSSGCEGIDNYIKYSINKTLVERFAKDLLSD